MKRRTYKTVDGLVRYTMGRSFYRRYKKLKGQCVDLLAEGPLINWVLGRAAKNLRISRESMDELVHDGRTANALITAWFASHGYRRVSDGSGGFLLVQGKKLYRLRIGTETLSFASSSTKGMGRNWNPRKQKEEMAANRGFIVVFTQDMPIPETYLISTDYVLLLQNAGLLNSRWEGPSGPIRNFMRETATGLRER